MLALCLLLLQGKLQMARDVRRDNVKVEHFMAKLDILMEPSTLSFVKNLQVGSTLSSFSLMQARKGSETLV